MIFKKNLLKQSNFNNRNISYLPTKIFLKPAI